MTEQKQQSKIIEELQSVDNAAMLMFFLLFIGVVIVQFTWPLNCDNGAYYWMGTVLLEGGEPYIDYWDIKGPIIGYIYATLLWLFGDATWGVRLLDVFVIFSGMVAMGYIVRQYTNRFIAVFSALTFGLMLLDNHYMAAQPEEWMTVLAVNMLAFTVMDRGRMRIRYAAMAGFCAAAMILLKYPYGVLMALPVLYVWLHHRPNVKIWLRYVMVFSAFTFGSMAVIYFITLSAEAFWEMVDVIVGYALASHRDTGAKLMMHESTSEILEFFFYCVATYYRAIPIALFFIAFMFWKKYSPILILSLVWLLFVLAILYIQGRYMGYYIIPLFPPIVLGMACALHAFSKSTTGTLLVLIVAAFGYHHYQFNLKLGYYYLTDKITPEHYQSFFAYYLYPPPTNLQLDLMAEYLEKNTAETDTITTFGYMPLMLVKSHRQSTSRYGFDIPLVYSTQERRERYLAELMHDMKATPPPYISFMLAREDYMDPVKVMVDRKLSFQYTLFEGQELRKFMDDHYYVDHVIGPYFALKYHNDDICYPQHVYMYYVSHVSSQPLLEIFSAPNLQGMRDATKQPVEEYVEE